jgi:predicted nucleotidyltransferase
MRTKAKRSNHATRGNIERAPRAVSALDALGVSPSAEKTVQYFATHPRARPYARELQRTLGLGGASAQRDLERLTEIGALTRSSDGRLVRYSPQLDSRFWRGVRLLIADPREPASLLRAALCDVDGVTAAFIFGSTAKQSARADSDIDIFVVEDPAVDRKALHRQLAEAALLLGRDVNPTRYTVEKLAERLGNRTLAGARFVRDVLSGPKQWIAGTPEVLRPLSLAAGISIDRIESTHK